MASASKERAPRLGIEPGTKACPGSTNCEQLYSIMKGAGEARSTVE
jgi:hypothetical protein